MTEKLETLISSLPGWCSIKKANTLHELVKRCDAKVVVEIGTFGGRAAIALASACKETGGKYYGIDPYDYQASLEGNVNKDHDEYWTSMDFDTVYDQMILGLTEAGLMDCVELVKKRSQDAFGQFKDIDVLYIDGNPSPEVHSAERPKFCVTMEPKLQCDRGPSIRRAASCRPRGKGAA